MKKKFRSEAWIIELCPENQEGKKVRKSFSQRFCKKRNEEIFLEINSLEIFFLVIKKTLISS